MDDALAMCVTPVSASGAFAWPLQSGLYAPTLSMILSAGARLGPYELHSALGAGGMGEVYRARDVRLGRDVANKVLSADLSADADRLRRFEQEARAAAALNHPNVLAVYDIGTSDGEPYIVSELLHGETLRASSSAPGGFTVRDVASDGRFLLNVTAEDTPTPPIIVTLNWAAALND